MNKHNQALVAFLVGMACLARASVCTWTGAEDAFWTNANNWAEGVVPGVVKLPGVAESTLWTQAQTTEDSAVFSLQTAHKVIDLDGLHAISNVTVTGSSAPRFVFGTATNQLLPMKAMNARGSSFVVTRDVPAAPEVLARFAFGVGAGKSSGNGLVVIQNDSSSELVLNEVGAILLPSTSDSWIGPTVEFRGAGDVRIRESYNTYLKEDGVSKPVLLDVAFAQKGTVHVEKDFGNEKNGGIRRISVPVDGGGALELASEAVLTFGIDQGSGFSDVKDDFRVEGEGLIRFCGDWRPVYGSRFVVAADKTLTIGTRVACWCPGTSTTFGEGNLNYYSAPGGRVVYTRPNEAGAHEIMNGTTVAATSVGAPGEPSALGSAARVYVGQNGCLSFIGDADDATTKTITLTNWAGSAEMRLDAAGAGLWDVQEAFAYAPGVRNAKIVLTNTTAEGRGVLRKSLVAPAGGTLAVEKGGPGAWTLDAPYKAASSLILAGGSLVAPGKAVLDDAPAVVFKDSSTLYVFGQGTAKANIETNQITKLMITNGINRLVISNAVVVVPSTGNLYHYGQGALDVVMLPGPTTNFYCKSSTWVGKVAPSWLTLNGKACEFKSGATTNPDRGRLIPRDYPTRVEIAATGSTIKNGATAHNVFSSNGPGGDVTLGTATTKIKSLRHLATANALINLSGRTFNVVNALETSAGSGSIQVGKDTSSGTFNLEDNNNFTFHVEDPAHPITLYAPLTLPSMASKTGDGALWLYSKRTFSASSTLYVHGGSLIFKNDLGTLPFKVGGGGNVVKLDATDWRLTVDQSGFHGNLILSNGTAAVHAPNGLGNADHARVTVAEAAMLVVSNNTETSFGDRTLVLAGAGKSGDAALSIRVNKTVEIGHLVGGCANGTAKGVTNSSCIVQMFGASPSAPATIDVPADTRVEFSTMPYVDLKNAKIRGTGTVGLKYAGSTVSPYTTLATRLRYADGVDFGDAVIDLGDRCGIVVNSATAKAPAARIISSGAVTFLYNAFDGGLNPEKNRWDGPIELLYESSRFYPVSYYTGGGHTGHITLAGRITGVGALADYASPGSSYCRGVVYFTNTNNSWSGGVVMNSSVGSRFNFKHPAAFPEASRNKLSVNGTGAARVSVEKPYWSDDDILRLMNAGTFSSGGCVSVVMDDLLPSARRLRLDLAGISNTSTGIGVEGEDAQLTITGIDSGTTLGLACYNGATLTLTGERTFKLGRVVIGQDRTSGGLSTFIVDGAKSIVTTSDTIYLGKGLWPWATSASSTYHCGDTSWFGPGVYMRITNSNWTTSYNANPSMLQDGALFVGHAGTAVLEIEAGTVFTNKLVLGGCANYSGQKSTHVGTGCGAVYQRDGDVTIQSYSQTSYGNIFGCSYNSHGFYELNKGRFTVVGMLGLGAWGIGIFHQHGGTASLVKNPNGGHQILYVGDSNGGKAVLYLDNGSFTLADDATTTLNNGNGSARGIIAVEGTNTYLSLGKELTIGNSYNSQHKGSTSYGYVCMNDGGVLAADNLRSRYANATGTVQTLAVSFNGGTFRLTQPNVRIFDRWTNTTSDTTRQMFSHEPDLVTIGPRGATIDTNGKDAVLVQPFLSATGGVVKTIPFSSPKYGFASPPYVDISGDGFGASAVALFDSTNRCVTGVRVTSGGAGYTKATASFSSYASNQGGSALSSISCTVGMAEPGGDFTKAGDGTLTINTDKNDWRGRTVVTGGTLRFGVDYAVPTGTVVRLDGGKLDLNGKRYKFDSVSGSRGNILGFEGTYFNVKYLVAGDSTGFWCSGCPLRVTDEWVVQVDDLLADVYAHYNLPIVFAPGCSLRIEGDVDKLDPRHGYYRILSSGGHPITDFEALEFKKDNLPPRWQIYQKGNEIRLSYPKGSSYTFR